MCVGSINFRIIIYIDYVGIIFLRVVLIISSIVLLYRMEYIAGDKAINQLKYFIFLFVLSMCLIILRPNILRILLG